MEIFIDQSTVSHKPPCYKKPTFLILSVSVFLSLCTRKGPPNSWHRLPFPDNCISIQGPKSRERDRMSFSSCRKWKGCISSRNIAFPPPKAEMVMRLQQLGGNHCTWMRLETQWKGFHFLRKSFGVRKREEMEIYFFFPLLETLELRIKHLFNWDDKAWSSCFRCICAINRQFHLRSRSYGMHNDFYSQEGAPGWPSQTALLESSGRGSSHAHPQGSGPPHSSWGSQGQNSPFWYPCGGFIHVMQQSRKGATYNFQKSHLRTAWSTSQSPFWNICLWIHPLNQGSSVQSTRDAARLLNDSRASKPSQHILYISARQIDWDCFCMSLKELNKSKLNTSIVLILLFYIKTTKKCTPLAFCSFLLVLLNMH